LGIFAALLSVSSAIAQNSPEVKLMVASAGPRAVESRTEQTLIRDYSAAWKSLADASETVLQRCSMLILPVEQRPFSAANLPTSKKPAPTSAI